MNKEEIKNEFINCIESSLTLNLAISVLEDREELKAKVEQYENPKDLTLMYMYCDEKAKDKIKELEKDIKNLVRIISKNCDDLEATEEEFESLYRWENE